MTADVVLLPTMWVRLIEFDVVCIISVRDFNEAKHEDLETDGNEPMPARDAPTEQSAADVAPISGEGDTDTEPPMSWDEEGDEWPEEIEPTEEAITVPDLQTLNATKAITLVRATDWSAEGLKVVSDQESEGKKRKTVLRAIEAQREELEE